MSLEEFVKNLTKEDLEAINLEFAKKEDKIPTFTFGKITFDNLKSIVDIEKKFDDEIFDSWFDELEITQDKIEFLEILLKKYGKFIKAYKEETLKANFIIPIINSVDYQSIKSKFSTFYEEILIYENDKFILNGEVDFVVSRGLEYSEKPYFFIQEFKKGKQTTDPEPQLLAELISGVELNNWKIIKGAYIVGSIWNFVILEKLGKDKYQYFVSPNFDSTKIEDLKGIYKNLLFVKNEIIEMIKNEK